MPASTSAFARWTKPLVTLGFTAFLSTHLPAGDNPATADLTKLSLEELMRVEVTSVARKGQPLSRSAAAIFVITNDDIKRSAARTVPELLRMVPGLFVSKLDGSKWGVSSRGPAGRFVANMLVLIDGRTVYTPLFSGVLWENNEFIMEDIDRIEVIRGPGAVSWGSNAVCGVVNIITKNAARTKGEYAAATVGNLNRPVVELRHGGAIKSNGAYRVFGRLGRYGNLVDEQHSEVHDGYSTNMAGFRVDLNQGQSTRWMLEGSGQTGTIHQRDALLSTATGQTSIVDSSGAMNAGNLLGRWTRGRSDDRETRVQIYYDWFDRHPFLGEERHTVDLDLGQTFRLGSRHGLVAGGGYRYSWDSIPALPRVHLFPQQEGIGLLNGYLQDEIRLAETVSLSLGARLESSHFAGGSFQPAVQFMWTPNSRQSVWAASARALRTPSRGEQGFSLLVGVTPPGFMGSPLPSSVTLLGQKDMKSEALHSAEVGYRNQISPRLSLDLTAYYYGYNRLRAFIATGAPALILSPAPHVNFDLRMANGGSSSNLGGEIAANFKVNESWRLFATYTRMEQSLTVAPGMWNGSLSKLPRNLASLRSQTDFHRTFSLDADLYMSGEQYDGLQSNGGSPLAMLQSNLPAGSLSRPGDYLRCDVRLVWRLSPHWELSAGGENLLDKYHKELDPEMLVVGSLVRRSYFTRLVWRR